MTYTLGTQWLVLTFNIMESDVITDTIIDNNSEPNIVQKHNQQNQLT